MLRLMLAELAVLDGLLELVGGVIRIGVCCDVCRFVAGNRGVLPGSGTFMFLGRAVGVEACAGLLEPGRGTFDGRAGTMVNDGGASSSSSEPSVRSTIPNRDSLYMLTVDAGGCFMELMRRVVYALERIGIENCQ